MSELLTSTAGANAHDSQDLLDLLVIRLWNANERTELVMKPEAVRYVCPTSFLDILRLRYVPSNAGLPMNDDRETVGVEPYHTRGVLCLDRVSNVSQ